VLLHGDYPTGGEEPGTARSTVLEDVMATGIRPEHFYAPAHVRVWAAVLELCAEAQPVDIHTVAARCSNKADVVDLLNFSESTVRTPAPVWAALVMEKARCRRLLPMVEEALDELLAGRLRHVRLILEDVAEELTS
jgi:replicative DNA helicase